MKYLRIAWTRVRPVRRIITPPGQLDANIVHYLRAYMSGDYLEAEAMAWVYWGNTP